MQTTTRWQDVLSMLLGFWLLLSPVILGFYTLEMGVAVWHSFILGLVVAAVSIAALTRFYIWEEWVNVVLGLWLIASPFVLGFTGVTEAMWNHIIVGLLIGADAVWVILQKPHIHRAA